MEAKGRVAIHLPPLATEVFEVQSDYSRVIDVGCEVMPGVGCHFAQANDRVSYLWWETIDMIRIPRLVVRQSTTARKSARLSAKLGVIEGKLRVIPPMRTVSQRSLRASFMRKASSVNVQLPSGA